MDRCRVVCVFVAFLACVAAIMPAHARQRPSHNYCDRLQAEYRKALERPDRTASRPQTAETERLTRRLARARKSAERNGCTLSLQAPAGPRCRAIAAEVNQLVWQLSRAPGGNTSIYSAAPSYNVARLRDALASAGCNGPAGMRAARLGAPATLPDGSRRTLCVRLCDGYYFPIEFQASRQRLETDAVACQSMYAAAGQAELFVQSAGDDVANAWSLSGRRYGDQPYAFAFQESYAPACVAELHSGLRALAIRYYSQIPPRAKVAAARHKPPRLLPLPQARPPRDEDPETLANAAGRFGFGPQSGAVALADRRVKPVRMVGAAYYARLFDLTRPAQPPRPLRPLRPLFSIVGPAAAAEQAVPTSTPN